MKLKNILNEKLVKVGLESNTKEDVIRELLKVLIDAGKVSADVEDQLVREILDREKLMSTGIQHGVAIPHCKSKVVKELVACIGIKKEGIDFKSLDGLPSNIFIMTLSPYDRVGPHVQFLAEISMIIKTDEARAALLKCQTSREVLSVFGI